MDQQSPKDPDAALLLELIGGLSGFLGIGWFYSGNVLVGVLALVGWWICLAPLLLLWWASTAVGCCCCWPVLGGFWLLIPLLSGFAVKRSVQARQQTSG